MGLTKLGLKFGAYIRQRPDLRAGAKLRAHSLKTSRIRRLIHQLRNFVNHRNMRRLAIMSVAQISHLQIGHVGNRHVENVSRGLSPELRSLLHGPINLIGRLGSRAADKWHANFIVVSFQRCFALRAKIPVGFIDRSKFLAAIRTTKFVNYGHRYRHAALRITACCRYRCVRFCEKNSSRLFWLNNCT